MRSPRDSQHYIKYLIRITQKLQKRRAGARTSERPQRRDGLADAVPLLCLKLILLSTLNLKSVLKFRKTFHSHRLNLIQRVPIRGHSPSPRRQKLWQGLKTPAVVTMRKGAAGQGGDAGRDTASPTEHSRLPHPGRAQPRMSPDQPYRHTAGQRGETPAPCLDKKLRPIRSLDDTTNCNYGHVSLLSVVHKTARNSNDHRNSGKTKPEPQRPKQTGLKIMER